MHNFFVVVFRGRILVNSFATAEVTVRFFQSKKNKVVCDDLSIWLLASRNPAAHPALMSSENAISNSKKQNKTNSNNKIPTNVKSY